MLSLVKVRRNVLVTPKQTRGIGTKDQDLKFVDEPLLDMRTVDRDALETAIGAPAEQLQRSVVIQKRCKSPTQSGRRVSHTICYFFISYLFKFNNGWRIRFKTGTQWTNPLMGWTAGNDPMSGINLNFDSLEEAKTWAVSNGMFEHE